MSGAKKHKVRVMTDWSELIVTALGKSVEAILEAGRLLIEAKADLPHGEFEQMIEMEMPFGPRSAQRLMKIAADKRIAKATHVSDLPTGWGTLHEFAQLDDAQWQRAKLAGLIRSDVKRREITALRKGPKGTPKGPKPFDDAGDGDVALQDYLDAFVERYPPDQLDRLALLLRRFARDLIKPQDA